MQGRLSPMIDGRIQAFPWTCWQTEFAVAQKYGFHLFEWTLDQARLYENPFLTPDGQQEIRALCQRHKVAIPSLTGDCFMQAPFWKAERDERESLERDFRAVAQASAAVGIAVIVVPLVDTGRTRRCAARRIPGSFSERSDRFPVAARSASGIRVRLGAGGSSTSRRPPGSCGIRNQLRHRQ